MSLEDEYRQSDNPWSQTYIESLIRRYKVLEDPISGELQYVEADGWYGMRCKAYDTGNPEAMLDAIQLESAVTSIHDLAVKAATILAMHGWDEADIGAIIRDRKRRPGSKLVDEGIRRVTRHERGKREARDQD